MKKLIPFLVLFTIASCSHPLEKTIHDPFDHEYSLDTVEKSIESAAKERDWTIHKIKGENTYDAKLFTRGIMVNVKIVYTKKSVDVIYVASDKLGYDGTHINPKYGKWVRNLLLDIKKNLFAEGK